MLHVASLSSSIKMEAKRWNFPGKIENQMRLYLTILCITNGFTHIAVGVSETTMANKVMSLKDSRST